MVGYADWQADFKADDEQQAEINRGWDEGFKRLREKRQNMCHICVCNGQTRFAMDYGPENYSWRHETIFRGFFCPLNRKIRGKLIGKIPPETPLTVEIIHILEEPFCSADQGILKKQMFARFTNLRVICCSICGASSVEKDILQPHRKIKEIFFGRNPIRFIPVGFYQHAPSLEMADWLEATIEVIYTGTYANLQHFKWAGHCRNRIKTIEVGAFKNLPAFEFVDLKSNMLSFVNAMAFDNYNFVTHKDFSLLDNRFLCNKDLCPFMYKMIKSELAECKEPMHLNGRKFKQAISSIGTQAVQIRHTVDYGQSVRLSCTTCSYDKLHWQKLGTGAIGSGTLPSGCTVKQVEGTRITELVIEKVTQEEHEANYSCYNPSCITAGCPIPIISLTVSIMEPVWNLTDSEKKNR